MQGTRKVLWAAMITAVSASTCFAFSAEDYLADLAWKERAQYEYYGKFRNTVRWVGGGCLLALGAGVAAGGLTFLRSDVPQSDRGTWTGLVLGISALPVAGGAVVLSGAIKPRRDRADLAFRKIELLDYSTPEASLRRERSAEAALRRLALTNRFDRTLNGVLGVGCGGGMIVGPLVALAKGGSALNLLLVPVGIYTLIPVLKNATRKTDYETAYESYLADKQRSP